MKKLESIQIESEREKKNDGLASRSDLKKKNRNFSFINFEVPLVTHPKTEIELSGSSSPIAWHYTTGECFMSIASATFLIPSRLGLLLEEIPILLFSKNQNWEPAFRNIVSGERGWSHRLKRQNAGRLGGGLFRLGYTSEYLIEWKRLSKLANIPYKASSVFEMIGRSYGAVPSDWMGTFDALPVDNLIVQFFNGEEWVGFHKSPYSISLSKEIISQASI